jgi:hypothetical protein
MRSFSAASLFLAFLVQPALAQGVKDPPNYSQTSVQGSKKAQVAQDPSRPTVTKNVATGSLPAGMATRRVWRNGQLITIPQY